MRKSLVPLALAGAVALVGCDGFGRAMTTRADAVARAGGFELTADAAASVLAANPAVHPTPTTVETLANLWVDFVVLGFAANRVGGVGLDDVDLTALIRAFEEEALAAALRWELIKDVDVGREELRELFEEEEPGVRLRARHILVEVADDATAAARAERRDFAESLRTRLAAGEDFARLARAHSDDLGTRERGGLLDPFGRGELLPEFEAAAFALDVGETSDVVETPIGFHVIRLEERVRPDFDEIWPEYRMHVILRRQRELEEAHRDRIMESLAMLVHADRFDQVREIARDPRSRLSRRAGSRPLVTYDGGTFTVADFRDRMLQFTPFERAGVAEAEDAVVAEVLEGFTFERGIQAEADRRGIELSPARRDTIAAEARAYVEELVGETGLREVRPAGDETLEETVEREARALLERIVRNEAPVIRVHPLLSEPLRAAYGGRAFPPSFPGVVARVAELRGAALRQPEAPGP